MITGQIPKGIHNIISICNGWDQRGLYYMV